MIVDASVVVAYLNPNDVHHGRAWAWFRGLVIDEHSLTAPMILLPEVASGLQRASIDRESIFEGMQLLVGERKVDLVAVTRTVAHRAAELVAELDLRGCDAVYVALAELRGEPLISLDRRQVKQARAVIEAREP